MLNYSLLLFLSADEKLLQKTVSEQQNVSKYNLSGKISNSFMQSYHANKSCQNELACKR